MQLPWVGTMYNCEEELKNFKESLEKINSPIDAAELFSAPDSPIVSLKKILNEKLDALHKEQTNLVKARLALPEDESKWKFNSEEIDKQTASNKKEMDELKEFNKVFDDLQNVGTSPEALDKLEKKTSLQERLSSNKASFLEVIKSVVSNFIKAVKAKISGKKVDNMEALESGMKSISNKISVGGKSSEVGKKVGEYIKTDYKSRLAKLQKDLSPTRRNNTKARSFADKTRGSGGMSR